MIKNLANRAAYFLCCRSGIFNEFESNFLRKFMLNKFSIEIGMYSYGCFDKNRIPKNTIIGRYCSFSRTAVILNGNHGLGYRSLHPFLYNVKLGVVERESIERTSCVIEDDVWLGHNAIVLPSVSRIGRGAVIAAGAVVTKDVPRYAVVAGVPAEVIKYRFSDDVILDIEASEWWTMTKKQFKTKLLSDPDFFYSPELTDAS